MCTVQIVVWLCCCCVFLESHLKDRVDDSMSLPSSYETLVARTELAAVS